NNMMARNDGGANPQPQPIPLPDIAGLVLAETTTPAKDIPRTGQFSYVTGVTFLQQNSSMTAIKQAGKTPHAEPYKKTGAQWLTAGEDVIDVTSLSCPAGTFLKGFKESTPILRKIVTTEGVYGYNKGQALMYLMQQRPKEELPFLKGLLNNDTLVTSVFF